MSLLLLALELNSPFELCSRAPIKDIRVELDDNEYILRFSIGQATGTIDHIRKSWKLIQKIAKNID